MREPLRWRDMTSLVDPTSLPPMNTAGTRGDEEINASQNYKKMKSNSGLNLLKTKKWTKNGISRKKILIEMKEKYRTRLCDPLIIFVMV
ncbi:hypothetical protein L1987_60399 [Smallanthus sonchifolius]|uniref:Uncharacterized protein n=1 Tax=Smallanthus sonchifolius TaxID=185202 RepID=A0ACB9D8W1_9ASTR|nr:hypothetical protein L1987_60399 [Smallanthus sonchifolius]